MKVKKNILSFYLKCLGLVIIIALLLDLLFSSIILKNLDASANYKKIEHLIESSSDNEVPIFGSSIVRRNYFPDSIGFNTYNYGMAGSFFHTIEPLLKIELDKNKSTPIILDFDQHTFFYDPNIPVQLSNYVPFIENEHIREMLTEHDYFKRHYTIPGLRFFGMYTDYIRDYLKPSFDRKEISNKGGNFYPRNQKVFEHLLKKRLIMIEQRKEIKETQRQNPKLLSKGNRMRIDRLEALLSFKPDSTQVSNFKSLLTSYPERKFILVYSPQHWSKLKGLDDFSAVINFFETFETYENVELINFAEEEFSDDLFQDPGHMNIVGAKRFSGLLKIELETRLR